MMFVIKTLMFLISVFLILLVLVQRGRGGGLAGALGGMGGQSAFGTKAGDLFTRVTIIVAAVWILLCAASVKYFRPEPSAQFAENQQTQGIQAGAEPGVPNPVATGAAPAPGDACRQQVSIEYTPLEIRGSHNSSSVGPISLDGRRFRIRRTFVCC